MSGERFALDNDKEEFLKAWPGGYMENWDVYGVRAAVALEAVVAKCLAPFYSRAHDCLEIGCGLGFWTRQFLLPNFRSVTALDLLPQPPLQAPGFTYIEVPNKSYSCHGVADASIDFAWSFGVFCHLSLEANQEYLHGIFRCLRPGGRVALFYSNNDRRWPRIPEGEQKRPAHGHPFWCRNDFATTAQMFEQAGFVGMRDLMPELIDTMIYGEKPR